ncbi:MAG TPA: amidase family protein [Planctomycetota bacterium]
MRVLALLAGAGLGLLAPGAGDAEAQTRQRSRLVEATIGDLQAALQAGRTSSKAVVQGYLDRIAAYDRRGPRLGSFLAVNPQALALAHIRDLERASGLAHGPLFGLPVLLKDNIDTVDLPTTAGSLALRVSVPPDDAFLVTKLRNAGAIVLGKASLTEFANALSNNMPAGYSSLGGFGFNPYDPRPNPAGDGRPVLTPGGSSSGSGIAVAASLVTVAVGTETSGSILSPGHQNGVVGIKPTVGLVSRDGVIPITADMDTPGPLARTVTDAAILLGVLAGHDPADPATAACLVPGNCHDDYTVFLDRQALVGARIGVPQNPYWFFGNLSSAERDLLLAAIDVLRAEGAVVLLPYEIPNQAALTDRRICDSYPPAAGCSTVMLYGFRRDLDAYLAGLGPFAPIQSMADVIAFNEAHPLEALRYGQGFLRAAGQMDLAPSSADTARYVADRALDVALFRGALGQAYAGPDTVPGTDDDLDALLFPSFVGSYAPAVAGYPSLVVPIGFRPPSGNVVNPRPVGMAFSGPAFSEPRLIALAYAYEQATRHRRPPQSTPELLAR